LASKNGNAEFNEHPYRDTKVHVVFKKEYRIDLAFKMGTPDLMSIYV
jgi:hypothetical protein